jgi:hypothetical protein
MQHRLAWIVVAILSTALGYFALPSTSLATTPPA